MRFYTENGMVDLKTAKSMRILKSIAADIKNNLAAVEKIGMPITPASMSSLKKLPQFISIFIFYIMLSVNYTRDVLLGNHARAAKDEYLLLDKDFNTLCNKNGVRP